ISRLAAIKAGLDADQRMAIVRQAEALKERQARKDDESILPKVGLEDIPPQMAYVAAQERLQQPLPLTTYGVGTNGLVYQQVVIELPAFSAELLDLLPLYANVLTELGVGDLNYLDTQLWQSRVCGSLSAAIGA